jgi:hypothetical protein
MSKHRLIKRSLAGGLAVTLAGLPSVALARVDGGPNPDQQVAVSRAAPYTLPSNFHTDASSGGYTPAQVSGPSVQDRLDQLQSNVRQRFAAGGGWPSAASSVPSTATSHSSFQWGDAGIGAAGAVVLMGVGALGATATRRRRRPVVS